MASAAVSHRTAEAPQTADPLVSVEGLSVDFATPRGTIHALRDISLEVPKGKVLGLVGESGCGKSTLAYSMIGLLAENARVAGGAIRMGGQDLAHLKPKAWRDLRGTRIAMIFQDPMTSLNPVTTIGKQMIDIQYREPISRSEKRARAIEFLEQVQLPDAAAKLDVYPHQLSGGMRQRVCIAMALLTRPDLLIADEPTTALDATLELQIVTLLRELQETFGCSVLFVSHHLGTVAELCDEVAVMYAGEVVERGHVREVFHAPRHPYTQALFDCDPARIRQATRQLPTIPGTLPDLRQPPAGCAFRARCSKAFGRCAAEHPPLHAAGPGQVARCHLNDPAEDVA
ncbi:ABC transporter ATP-binding protein [Alloyangia pacifica]|uniref:Peptide/nickel transport system ATP-binding protein n=1 Tax=Alloyangia pacifica TaxID=311180 RepID=A0A1I6UP93_9RHOB|nr:ABC transporter ATP-binding protein [Alloyangia pacifica]SDH77088.1 peptide/nickel transport system ATP-binding protein [Alloyangia pacifica]SFT03223.1 peptide/nickel transport system ATP-binding protein [Alloyangia pacifica]